ncbi:MAG: YceK/YidQ family lipoprotein [Enterobacteriaceae bacterium]|nr:YceK/YidQ family lipoprotein [Enterobacteriaceae bacterium]
MKHYKRLFLSSTVVGWSLITGCTSIMTHSGPNQGYYSGTQTNINMLKDEETGWILKPVLVVDLPLSAFLDTLLLPYDYAFSDQDQAEKSPKLRIEKLKNTPANIQPVSLKEPVNDEI